MEHALDGSHAYRLKEWPTIPDRFRTARVLGACSRMSVGPVTANWFLNHTGLQAVQCAELMSNLLAQGAIERIDLSFRTAALPAAAAAAPDAGAKRYVASPHRFSWKQAALAVLVCLGISAAVDDRLPGGFGIFAVPNLPAVSG